MLKMVQTSTHSENMIPQPFSGYYPSFPKPQTFPMDFAKPILLPLQSVNQNQRSPNQPSLKPIKPKPMATHHFRPTTINPYSAQSVSIQRRNARERNRVKQVNDGFTNLRQHIPNEVVASLLAETPSGASPPGRGANRKLSKVDTLKLTVEYIRRLQETLMMADSVQDTSQHPKHDNPENKHLHQQYLDFTPHVDLLQAQSNNYSPATTSPAPSSVSSSDMSTSSSSYGTSGYYQPYYDHQTSEFKNENYDSSDPQDEEILDCISWWQQQ